MKNSELILACETETPTVTINGNLPGLTEERKIAIEEAIEFALGEIYCGYDFDDESWKALANAIRNAHGL